MRLPFLEFVKRRFHYELDKAQEEYNRALGRMEDGEFERGFIAGLERGLYLIEDSKESWGYNPLDDIPKPDDDDTNDEDDTDDSGSTEGSGEGSGEGTDSEDGGSGSGSEGSSGGSGDGSSGDGDDPKLDLPLDAMTQ